MKELRTDTKKRLFWLLAEAKKNGGKITIKNNTTRPGFDVVIWSDDATGAEIIVHDSGCSFLEVAWAFRVVILKDVLVNDLPVYPTMWRDAENGLNHTVRWIERDGQPELMQPEEFYDSSVQLINHHIALMWRTHQLPALKDEHVEAN